MNAPDNIAITPAPAALRGPRDILHTMDACTKCGLCQVYCPVAAVTGSFPGPKYTGPQAQRFRVVETVPETGPDLCTGCGVCASMCPNDVAIADIITIARHESVAGRGRLPLLQRLLNRPDLIGAVAGRVPRLANLVLRNRLLRLLAERLVGLDRDAPLPRVTGPTFARWFAAREQPAGPSAVYFAGCAVENYEPQVGIALVEVLNALGMRVRLSGGGCCSLPMLSSGEWDAARPRAEMLTALLATESADGAPILSASTSCSLTLRSKYAAYLGMRDGPAQRVAGVVRDVCEFLLERHAEALAAALKPLPARVLYHGPCQLRGHGMGQPAVELLRMVPGLNVHLSLSDCCGVGGTYGYSADRAPVSRQVGRSLADQARELVPDAVVCDSETCRWSIARATGLPVCHPVEVIRASLVGRRPW